MKAIIKKLKSNEGSVLFVVLVIMTVAILLGTSVLALTRSDYKQTQIEYIDTQAYYTASAALDGMVSYILSDVGSTLRTEIVSRGNLNASMPSGDPIEARIGSYDISISHFSGDLYKIVSTGVYAGTTEKVSAYLEIKNTPLMDAVFTSTGKNGPINTTINGSSKINGNANFALQTLELYSLTMGGTISNTKDIMLRDIGYDTSPSEPIDLICGGNLTVSDASSIGVDGGIYVGGNMSVSGGLDILSPTEVYVGGNFTGQYENIGTASKPVNLYVAGNYVNSYEQTVYGDIYVGGYYNAPKVKVVGTVYIAGSADIPSSQIKTGTTVVKNTEPNMATLTAKLGKTGQMDIYNDWEVPAGKFTGHNLEVKFTTSATTATISQSGILTKYEWVEWIDHTLNLDTTAGDLYIKVNTGAATFTFGNTSKVNIIGSNNVYFMLADGMKYTQNQTNVGSLTDNPKFYLIVNGNSEVTFDNSAVLTFNGYIYAPKSIFNVNSASSPSARLRGGIVAGYINHGSCALTFDYIAPSNSIPNAPVGGNKALLSGYGRS